MTDLLTSPRWLQFAESTAQVLDLSMTVVEGSESSIWDVPGTCPRCGRAFPPFGAGTLRAALAGRASPPGGLREISVDGSPGFVFRVSSHSSVVVRDCPLCSTGRPDLFNRASLARRLLEEFHLSLDDSLAEAGKAAQVSAVRQVNLIILSLFQEDEIVTSAALERGIDLILSALVVMLDSEGSWLSYRLDGQDHLIVRGDAGAVGDFIEKGRGMAASVALRSRGIEGTLGALVSTRGQEASSFLGLLAQECSILFEIERLFRLVQSRLRQVLNGSGGAAFILDSRGNYTYANAAAGALLHERLPDILGKNSLDFSAPWDRAASGEAGAPLAGTMDRIEIQRVIKWVDWRVLPVVDSGVTAGWVVLVEDRTDRHRWQQSALEAERLAVTASTMSMLAHELRNPLAAASGILQLLVQKRSLDMIDRYVPLLGDELGRATRLLNEFLMLGRPAPVSLKPLDMVAFLDECLPLLTAEAEAAGASLEIESVPVPPVRADSGQLIQVALNLVRNAVEAAGRGGRVRLSLRAEESAVILECEDSGSGLSEEVLRRLFQPFFTTKQHGTGLGLTVSRAIAENHGGSMAAANSSLGGALFRVSLPAVSDAEPRGIDVAVVLSDEILRLACEHALRRSGLQVVSARGSTEALGLECRFSPRLIVVNPVDREAKPFDAGDAWSEVPTLDVSDPLDYEDLLARVHSALGSLK